MVDTSQQTIYSIDLAIATKLQLPYTVLANTTLNEKFNFNTGYTLANGQYPYIKYYAIGTGGTNIIGNAGYMYNQHSPTDAALFNQIPFVIRPLTNDLTPAEQLNYRFRMIEVINNIQYAAYYLRVVPAIDYRPYLYYISSVNGTNTLGVFNNNTSSLLNPTPIDKTQIVNNNTANYVTKLAKLEFLLTAQDLVELNNVASLLNISPLNISEIAVCSGVDTVINGVTEAAVVQILYHLGVNIQVAIDIANNTPIDMFIEIGGSEVMMV